jgi:hypothetical protein
MSLINDALKRAREAQRNTLPPGAAPLPPVEAPVRGGAGWILAASAILFLGAAGLILIPALLGHKPLPAASVKAPEIPAPMPVAAAPSPATAAPPPAAITNPPPVANTSSPQAVAAVEKLPKVQGIIFNANRPIAIVSGQTVNVGDRVGDFRVKQITQNSVVFLRADGTQKILGIGD